MKQPYLPLYTGDWKKDPKLSLCSVATRGVWIDLLCSLHDGRIGQVTGTPEQIARLCRCNAAECHAALLELQTSEAANVSERNGVFTVVCRRMKRTMEISQLRADAASKRGSKPLAKPKQTLDIENEDETLKKIREFARGEGISEIDADWFFWKCQGNGWTNGGRPILSWEATLRSWSRAGFLPSQKHNTNGQGHARPMSVFEIDKRIEAVSGEINKIFRSNGGKRTNNDGIDQLKKRKADLQKQKL